MLNLALTLNKAFWKCHSDFTCQWMGDIRTICLLSENLHSGNPLSYTIFAVDSNTDSDKCCANSQWYREYRCHRRRCCRWRCCSHRLSRFDGMLLHQEEKATCLRAAHPSTDNPADAPYLTIERYHRGLQPSSRCTKRYKRRLPVAPSFSAASVGPRFLSELTGKQMASYTATVSQALAARPPTDLLPASARSSAR